MQYSEGKMGRVFALRLEHGEAMPQVLEQFAVDHNLQAGVAIMVGGAEDGSKFVVGPQDGTVLPPVPVTNQLQGVHEVAAVGTIFPDESGTPMLHMHAAFGRGDEARSGCIRAGIVAWHVLEIVVIEVTGLNALRCHDPETGFELLTFAPE